MSERNVFGVVIDTNSPTDIASGSALIKLTVISDIIDNQQPITPVSYDY